MGKPVRRIIKPVQKPICGRLYDGLYPLQRVTRTIPVQAHGMTVKNYRRLHDSDVRHPLPSAKDTIT